MLRVLLATYVGHKVKPGWCFLNSKSHLITTSQKPAGLGCSFQNPTKMECLLESLGNLAAVANSTQAVWESGIMLNSRICSTSWNKIAVLKLPVDRNHRFSIKLTLKKGLLSRETFLLKPFFKTKCFHLYNLKGLCGNLLVFFSLRSPFISLVCVPPGIRKYNFSDAAAFIWKKGNQLYHGA